MHFYYCIQVCGYMYCVLLYYHLIFSTVFLVSLILMETQNASAVLVTMDPFVILVLKVFLVHHQIHGAGHVIAMVTLIQMSQAHVIEKQDSV